MSEIDREGLLKWHGSTESRAGINDFITQFSVESSHSSMSYLRLGHGGVIAPHPVFGCIYLSISQSQRCFS